MEDAEKKIRLSVSKTKTYTDCKKKFEFSYVLKLPKKERDYHILGKFCHKVLEDFHKIYLEGCDDPYHITMNACFKAAQEEYKKQMTSEMTKEAFAMMKQYLQIVSEEKKNGLVANVIGVEKNFEVELDGFLTLNGMIDRIQLDSDNVIHVADYKTTKNKKYLADDFFQLLTYAYVIVSENPDIDKVRASYILLRHDFEYITQEFSLPKILEIKDKYLKYAKEINLAKEYPPNPTKLCGWCDFLDICSSGREKVSPSTIYGEVEW